LDGLAHQAIESSGDKEACVMESLLLILLVVYFAVVSAPVSIRLVGLLLTRHSFSALPQSNFKPLS
jgi:hypothetical protein